MRRTAFILAFAAVIVVAVGCGGGGKYADAKKAIKRQYEMMDTFTAQVDKAQDSTQVIAALKEFQKNAEASREGMMQVAGKYPELMDQKNPPEELKEEMNKMDEMMPRFIGAMRKIGQQYGQDPEVKKVLADMQSSLAPPQK